MANKGSDFQLWDRYEKFAWKQPTVKSVKKAILIKINVLAKKAIKQRYSICQCFRIALIDWFIIRHSDITLEKYFYSKLVASRETKNGPLGNKKRCCRYHVKSFWNGKIHLVFALISMTLNKANFTFSQK